MVENTVRNVFNHIQSDRPKALALWGVRKLALASPLSALIEPRLSDARAEQLYAAPLLAYWPRVEEPRTFNEKLLHRKLYENDPRFTTVSDKWQVRDYVRERVGDEILNDVYHVTDDPRTIPFGSLPSRYVLKSTHGQNQIIFVDDDDSADYEVIKAKCRRFLEVDYGEETRERWYLDIEPRILVERYLRDERWGIPPDFKFSVFHGSVELIEVHFDRFSDHTCRFYEPDWTPLNLRQDVPLGPVIDEPPLLDEMVEVAEALASDFDFIRVDLYQPDGDEVVFGEMTVAPAAGRSPFEPEAYDYILGSYW